MILSSDGLMKSVKGRLDLKSCYQKFGLFDMVFTLIYLIHSFVIIIIETSFP